MIGTAIMKEETKVITDGREVEVMIGDVQGAVVTTDESDNTVGIVKIEIDRLCIVAMERDPNKLFWMRQNWVKYTRDA